MLLIVTVLYSVVFKLNNMTFAFLPINISPTVTVSLKINGIVLGDTVIGIGLNVLGFGFIAWWYLIRRRNIAIVGRGARNNA